jgi:hypothetical protein
VDELPRAVIFAAALAAAAMTAAGVMRLAPPSSQQADLADRPVVVRIAQAR